MNKQKTKAVYANIRGNMQLEGFFINFFIFVI